VEFRTGKARARDHRLEIAGQQPLALAQARDANGLKVPFEEGARGIRILRLQLDGVAADVPQGSGNLRAIAGALCLARGAAARLIGGERGEMIIGRPARELAPLDRLELAA